MDNKNPSELNLSTADLPNWQADEDDIPDLTPKTALKNFILATIATDENTDYSFVIPSAKSMKDATAFIHRMRVELSRQRTRLAKLGRKPKQFGVKIVSIDCEIDEEKNKHIFTANLSTVAVPEKPDEMDSIMDALCID